jgi:hypothetical protein
MPLNWNFPAKIGPANREQVSVEGPAMRGPRMTAFEPGCAASETAEIIRSLTERVRRTQVAVGQ